MTHDELAAMANLARNSTAMVLRSLASRALIKLSYRGISVLDSPPLRALVDRPDRRVAIPP